MRSPVLLALVCAAGCYTYRPVELASVAEGTNVRARISATEAERVEPLIGRADARVLEGVVVQSDSANLLLQVPAASRTAAGGSVEVLHQRLALARADVLEVELKQLNRARTYGLVGVGMAAAVYLAIKALNSDPGREGPPGGGQPPEFRSPVFRPHR